MSYSLILKNKNIPRLVVSSVVWGVAGGESLHDVRVWITGCDLKRTTQSLFTLNILQPQKPLKLAGSQLKVFQSLTHSCADAGAS